MKFRYLLLAIILFSSYSLSAKIGIGAGGDVSPNAARLSVRGWFSKYNGAELGFGPTAKFEDFKFDDMSMQAKFFHAIRYDRYARTYLGMLGRFTIIKDPFFDKNLPSVGVFGGKEWYLGRYRNQGVAVEAGLIYGKVKGQSLVFENGIQSEQSYTDFPAYISLSYKYYF